MAGRYATSLECSIWWMRRQYEFLLDEGWNCSLRELFSTSDFDIVHYCRDFRPSRFGEQACAEAERFSREHHIWLEVGGDHYNSMTPYLHPGAITVERMAIIGIYNAILFWLNDTVGREKFGQLAKADQQRAEIAIQRTCRLLETRSAPNDPTSLENSILAFLAKLAPLASSQWLDRFLVMTVEHLRLAIRDQNARSRGWLPSVTEYTDLRAYVSGMYPAIALCEFGRGQYLPWDRIAESGLHSDLRRIHRLTVDIGALTNDMFSFEKECIADRSDFNLIPVCLLNNPGWSLIDAIRHAAKIVGERIAEFCRMRDQISEHCAGLVATDAELEKIVTAHLGDLVSCVQATWVWQLRTLRYKGVSIFTENRLG